MVRKQRKSKDAVRGRRERTDFMLKNGGGFEDLGFLPEHFAHRELSLLKFFRRVLLWSMNRRPLARAITILGDLLHDYRRILRDWGGGN